MQPAARTLPVWVRVGLVLFGVVSWSGRALGQQTTGKIQGTVTGENGEPLAKAQVAIPGTAFGAVTDDKGYYFLNNVLVGTYTLRAQYIGYAPTEQPGARVLGGQTLTVDFKMFPSAIIIGGINVVAAANPIVPRDEVTSKSIVSGQLIHNLPVDNIRSVIVLQPGVVESGSGLGVSIRGGRPGEANVYVDGAPTRQQNDGSQGIDVQTNAVEEASVTTGAIPVQFGDAQSGVISFTTKAGGERLAGSIAAEGDGMFGNAISTGYNRFEGSIGGPVPAISHLRFFLSAVVQGQSSTEGPYGEAQVPTYTVGGVDTTVLVSDSLGTERVTIPRFVQFSGACNPAQNFGVSCQGIRRPDNWNTQINLQGKLTYGYGSGSSISLSGLASGQEARSWPGRLIADPTAYVGSHAWARTATLNWVHSLFKGVDRALSTNVILSYSANHDLAGPLDPTSEAATRDPLGGIEFATLDFDYGRFASDFLNHPDQIIRNLRYNEGERAPFLLREDLHFRQPYRMNPYGMATGGWATEGIEDFIGNTLSEEQRLYGSVNVDWQANRYHRFTVGGELKRSDAEYWSGFNISADILGAYHARPAAGAAWVSDRLDLGDVVVDLGVRYDYYSSQTLFPRNPGFVAYNDPAWNLTGAGVDTSYAGRVARTFVGSIGHHALSPRLGVSFPITDQTDLHLSYSHQVQSPNLGDVLSGDFVVAGGSYGEDVEFGKTIQFEIGMRHAFSQDLVIDLTAYNKAKISDLSFRPVSLPNPNNPGQNASVTVLTNADFGYDRGLDLKIDRRIGPWLAAQVAYTFEVANGTGSSPLSYLSLAGRSIAGVTGETFAQAEQPRAVDDQRVHSIVGSLAVTVPQGWRPGSIVGDALSGVGAFVTFRVLSGLPYTPVPNVGGGGTAPGTHSSSTIADVNSASTPWTKYLNLRLNKAIKLGRLEVTAYTDIRNLFNWKNILGLFVETNDVTNGVFEHNLIAGEFVNLAFEAGNNGALLADGSVSLKSCGTWKGVTGVVDCVELQRTETRFGNGDGLYTVGEQTRALNAYYNLVSGPYLFNDLPRSVRLGLELTF